MKVSENILNRKKAEQDKVEDKFVEGQSRGAFALDSLGSTQQHIMKVLTNMYADPYRATVQETLSNAFDAHKRAGNTVDPIEIDVLDSNGNYFDLTDKGLQWGNALNSNSVMTFSVRDYGTGMTIDDLKNKFFLYGSSDKRDSADERGGFGLGCKAGLSLMGQIEVITVKDGKKTRAVGKMNDSENVVDYFELGDTDEPNGTTVITPFPASGIKRLINGITSSHMHMFWDGTPLVINGGQVTPPKKSSLVLNAEDLGWETIKTDAGTVWFNTKPVTANKYVNQGNMYNDHIFVNLGGVAYSVNERDSGIRQALTDLGFNRSSQRGYTSFPYYIAFDVPLTSLISLTPSRESILYDDNTVKNLKAMLLEKVELIESFVRNKVNSFDNPRDVTEYVIKNYSVLTRENRSWSMAVHKEIYDNILWRGERIFEAPKFNEFVFHYAYCKKLKTAKFVEGAEPLCQTTHPVTERSSPFQQASMVLVSVPEDFRKDKKATQKISLSSRAIASNFDDSIFFGKYEKSGTRFHNSHHEKVMYHFSLEPVETLKSRTNLLSAYSKIVSLEEFHAEAARLKALNGRAKLDKAAREAQEQARRNEPRHYVIKASNLKKVDIVSDNFLSDKQVLIITKEMYTKDFVSDIINVTKYVNANPNKAKVDYRFASIMGTVERHIETLAELYPQAYFLLNPQTRKVSPLFKYLPKAKHAMVKLVEDLDFSNVDQLERLIISDQWDKEFNTIGYVAEAIPTFPNVAELVKSVKNTTNKCDQKQQKTLNVLKQMLNPHAVFTPEVFDDFLGKDATALFSYKSKHFNDVNASESEKINIVKVLGELKARRVGAFIGFKVDSPFMFLEVLNIPRIPEKGRITPSAKLATTVAESVLS